MRNISLKELKEIARSKNIPLKKSYRKSDYIRELGLDSVYNTKRFFTSGIKVKAVNQETGEKIEFISKSSAAKYFNCSEDTIRNRLLSKSAIFFNAQIFAILEV